MIALVLGSDHDVGPRANRRLSQVEVFRHQPGRVWKRALFRPGIVHRDGEAHQMSERGQSLGDAAMADDQQFRLGQNGFDKDFHFASARHPYAQPLIAHVQGDQQGLTCFHAPQGFAFNGALGATPTNPSGYELALRIDNCTGTTAGRGGAFDANHGGGRKRFPLGSEFGGLAVEVGEHQ